jgi:predicted Zn-dependent protease
MSIREPLLVLSCIALAGCATASSETGRKQVVVPSPVSQVYSEVDLQVQLATAAAQTEDMAEDQCLLLDYQRQVRKLGERLVATAYRLYPGLEQRDVKFSFAVAPSAEPGILSNAGGAIVVLQGTEDVGLPDSVQAFVLAREMGHVIGRHHDENSAASVMFSALSQVLFPALALVRGVASILPTTVAATAATASAVSYLGATALRSTYREDQLREAEQIAFRLMAEAGYDLHAVAEEASGMALKASGDERWRKDLHQSLHELDQVAAGPRDPRQPLLRAVQWGQVAPLVSATVAAISGTPNP